MLGLAKRIILHISAITETQTNIIRATDEQGEMKIFYNGWRMWLLVFSGWTLFGIFFAFQSIVNNSYFGKPSAVGQIFISWLSCAYLWALLTPLVIRLARHFPLERKTIWRSLAIHFAVCLVLSILQLAVYVFVQQLLLANSLKSFSAWQSFQYLLVSAFHENLLLYWSLVALWHSADYYRRFRERERRAAQLELEAAQLETQLTRAQLDALKMQLHPHFLFNTLNSISVLMQEDVAAANRMLVRLSDLLRLALKNTGSHEISLKQELDFLRSYLEIEQTRFQDRLKVTIEADAETLDAKVPNLILQPLVENCIRHAVAPRAVASSIEIFAARRNGHLELTVRDDGGGIVEKTGAAQGIGLSNTRARLKKLYGSDQNFQLAPAPGGGLLVTVSIPFHTLEKFND